MLTLTQRLTPNPETDVIFTLALTAAERTRSRHYFETNNGRSVYLHLPRGTVLQQGDLLKSDAGDFVRVIAKAESVLTVTADNPLDLLRAAYHLGNRHVVLEVTATYLRLAPDPVLHDLLEHLGLHVIDEVAPFQPETGAYGHRH